MHQYHFANDLTWDGGPGYYLLRKKNVIVGLQCVVSGEHKDIDRFRGAPAEDTGITSVLPSARASCRSILVISAVELPAAEVPVSINHTALQVVPDYRLRASIAMQIFDSRGFGNKATSLNRRLVFIASPKRPATLVSVA